MVDVKNVVQMYMKHRAEMKLNEKQNFLIIKMLVQMKIVKKIIGIM
jgi:hypothetical protein